MNEKKKKKKPFSSVPTLVIVLLAICIFYNGWKCVYDCIKISESTITVIGSEDLISYDETPAEDDIKETEQNAEEDTTKGTEKESLNEAHVSNATATKKHIPMRIIGRILSCIVTSGLEISLLWVINQFVIQGLVSGNCGNVVSPEETDVSFEDVAGLDEIKDELMFLVSLLKDETQNKDYKIPHGVLFEGPPGNGKTMLAKALAHDAGINFMPIKGSDIISPYVGIASARIESMFKKAQENAPCIIFIDEIDAIGSNRVADPASGVDKEENSTLTTLLNQLDGFIELSGVMVIAATNMSASLDPALTRPGRFDKHFTINNPDFNTRKELFSLYTKRLAVAKSLDINSLARRTYGFNCAQIQNIVNEAKLLAIKNDRDNPLEQDFEDAVKNMHLNGFEKTASNRSTKDIETAAFHEAGHAIVCYYLDYQDINSISIKPTTTGAGGFTIIENSDENDFRPLQSIKNHIAVLYGGRAAEAHLHGKIENASTGAAQDITAATEMASCYVSAEKGIDYSIFGAAGVEKIMAYSQDVLSEMWEVCQKIIKEHWDEVVLVAEELKQSETISAARFKELMAPQ